VSDSKKYPGPPPDDFSKTTPNIPRADNSGASDWEKTNYNAPKFAPQPPADDWGKTIANIQPIKEEPDFNKTYMPVNNPKAPDWGVTDTNIKLPDNNFGGDNIGNQTNYGATSPFIQLPEAERAKYQNLPPTPTQAAEQKRQEEKKGGIPGWFWAVGGLLTLFFFAVIAIVLVYFFFLRPTGFEIVIQSAPSRAEVWVDNTRWGITEGDGTLRVPGLKSRELKRIEIRHSNFTCEPREIEGKDGETVTITARCTQTAVKTPPPSSDCENFKVGEFDRAQRCANQALDNLKEPYSAEDVTKALNMYIINFDVNKFDIKPNDLKFLEKASQYIKKLPPATVIEVGGHTDSDGPDQKNQLLSDNRAKSVRDAFVNNFGVNPSMLKEKGYGESRPRPNNQNRTPDEKFQNRRIEYNILSK
jgi:outer membrane protein OmpA-like peptidoglycan-associated protein